MVDFSSGLKEGLITMEGMEVVFLSFRRSALRGGRMML